jgi:hypothetical protein
VSFTNTHLHNTLHRPANQDGTLFFRKIFMSIGAALTGLGAAGVATDAATSDNPIGVGLEGAAELGISLAFPIAGTLGVLAYEGLKSLTADANDPLDPQHWAMGGWLGKAIGEGMAATNPQGSLPMGGMPAVQPPPNQIDPATGQPKQEGKPSSMPDMGMLGLGAGLMALPGLGKGLKGVGGFFGKALGGLKGLGAGLLGFGLGSALSGGGNAPQNAPGDAKGDQRGRMGLRQPNAAGGIKGVFSGMGRVGKQMPGTKSASQGNYRPQSLSGGFSGMGSGGAGVRAGSSLNGASFSSRAGLGGRGPMQLSGSRGGYQGGDAFRVARQVDQMVGDGGKGFSTYAPPVHPESLMGRAANSVRHSESRGG